MLFQRKEGKIRFDIVRVVRIDCVEQNSSSDNYFLSVLNVILSRQVIGQGIVCIGLFSVSGNCGFSVLTERQESEL